MLSVRIVIGEMAFLKTKDEDETANLIWNDSAVQHEKIAELRNYQVKAVYLKGRRGVRIGWHRVFLQNLVLKCARLPRLLGFNFLSFLWDVSLFISPCLNH